MQHREVGGERDRVTAGRDSQGREQDGDPRAERIPRGMDVRFGTNARLSPRCLIPLPLFISFLRGHGARIPPAAPPGAGVTHSTASRRPCPAGPRRSPAAPPTWLRAAAPCSAACKSHANERRSARPAERGRKPGPGERTRGKRGAEGRENGPASCARGRALYANEAGGRGSRALYANETGRAVGGAKGEAEHARHANEMGGDERGGELCNK